MSLRARLLAGLVVLAAIGLVVMGAVTYAEQRSFLYQRVDQQLLGLQDPVSRELDAAGVNAPGALDRGGGPPFGAGGPGRGDGGPPRGAPFALPSGTYGQRRDPSGSVLPGHVSSSYGETFPPPKLPARLPRIGRPFTVEATSGGLQYRAVAFPTRDEPGVTVAAVPLRDVTQALDRLLIVEGLVAAGVLLALVASAWLVIRIGLRPLDRIGRIAGSIAAGDLSRRVAPATERTEVGRLGVALNAMLGQIERAFRERRASEDRLRQFLADASHELRTPLAAIRGYAELFRIGAAREPAEVDKAMRRIEQESARMGVLVEDLLTLARLDELPDKRREPVDLAQLARDAADDARATAPDRPIDVHAESGTLVLGDVGQLRQVVANLTRNALVHTPAGTAVELSVTGSNGSALLEVRDYGPGLPGGADDSVFDRFWRADPGRGRGVAGAGLGLAIVAAIVDAHGGSVHARNADGGGASFTVELRSTT